MIRKLLAAFVLLAFYNFSNAQAPDAFNYQAVVRNISGGIVAAQPIGMQVSILQGSISGPAVYVETHSPTTNNYGLVSLQIGTGVVTSGAMNLIDWANNLYFVRIEIDPAGGSNYQISSTSQLVSVPYALHAKTAGNSFSGDYNDLINAPTDISTFNNDIGYIVTEVDGSVSNEIQNLTLVGMTLTLSNGGGSVVIPTSADDDPANEIQTLSIAGSTVSLSNGGGSVLIPASLDDDPTNEYITSANLTGNNLNIIDGGGTTTVDLSPIAGGGLDNDPTNELITSANLTGTDLNIIDAGGTTTVDLSSISGTGLDNDPTNELITSANLTGTDLNIIDAGGTTTVDLSSLSGGGLDNDPTNELITSANLTGTNLNIIDAGGTTTVDLSSISGTGLDNDPTNELITSANLTGTDLNIIDAGGTTTVDLSSLSGGGSAFAVGEHHDGGIIFWVDSSGIHGLIAAPTDIAGTHAWDDVHGGPFYGVVAGAQSMTDGASNTAAIVTFMGGGSTCAAVQANNLVSGGFSDWYLPSLLELQLLYQAAYVVQNLQADQVYWSSTEDPNAGGITAFEISMFGNKASQDKATTRFVRAIRAF